MGQPMSLPCANWLTTYEAREAWAADARNGAPDFSVGSSTVYKMLGLCPTDWGDLWTVHAAAKEGRDPDVLTTEPQLLRGQLWEPAVVQWHASARSADGVSMVPLCRVSTPKLPWLRPSPDAFILDDEEGWGVSEAKVLHASQAKTFENGATYRTLQEVEERLVAGLPAIPMHYMAQCMVMLAASGLPWCELAAVFSWDWDGIEKGRAALGKSREELLPTLITMGAVKVKTVRVERDPYALQSLVERLHQLRHTYLVNGVQPPPSSSGAYWEHLARNADGTRVATQPEGQVIRHYLERVRQHAAEGDSIKALKAQIGGFITPHKTVVIRQEGRDGRVTITKRGSLLPTGL